MKHETDWESWEPKQASNFSKYSDPDEVGRPGRLHRGEKKFRNHADHEGKGKTLRGHRAGKHHQHDKRDWR